MTPITRAVPTALLERALAPYKPNCRYLKSMDVTHSPPDAIRSDVPWSEQSAQTHANGVFSIPEPCYIESTGHFNAVEFNICVNQLAYTLTAYSVDLQLWPPFRHVKLSDFWRKQLSNTFIIEYQCSFVSSIDAAHFRGRFEIEDMWKKKYLVFLKTRVEFSDEKKGLAKGNVLFVLT